METVHEEDTNEDTNTDSTQTQKQQHNSTSVQTQSSPSSSPLNQKPTTQVLISINDKKTTSTSPTPLKSILNNPIEQSQLYEQLNQLKPLKTKQFKTSAQIYLNSNNNNDDQYKSDSETYTMKRSPIVGFNTTNHYGYPTNGIPTSNSASSLNGIINN